MSTRPLSPQAAASAISYGIRSGNSDALRYAAQVVASGLPSDPVLVPLPDLEGKTYASLMLAQEIAKISGGQAFDLLQASRPARDEPRGLLGQDALQIRAKGDLPTDLPEDLVLIDACELDDAIHRSARAALGRPDALSGSWQRSLDLADNAELIRTASNMLESMGRRIAAVVVDSSVSSLDTFRRQASKTRVTDDNGLFGTISSSDIHIEDRVRLRAAVAITMGNDRLQAPIGTVGEVIGRCGSKLVVVLPVELRRAVASGGARTVQTRMQACQVDPASVEVLLSSFDERASGLDRYRSSPWIRTSSLNGFEA